MTVLSSEQWRARERAHAERVDAATVGHRARRADGTKHPVEDFLFTYYANSVTALRRWHPGAGVGLADAACTERATWRFQLVTGDVVTVDLDAYRDGRGERIAAIRSLLTATLDRPAQFGCLGLHEWAMVHRLDPDGVRHPDWPLRLGAKGTDAVVESHHISCSHVDAFRFFTSTARPLNILQPTRDQQVALEQPGCLHAGMDCYKWAYQLVPAVPSELVMDCFDLARDIRVLDMRASPYDLSALGYEPVRIETREGKAAYVETQRAFTERSQDLRRRLLTVTDAVTGRSAA
ncbi:MAG: 3-methyladenine DNA glycosylase [Lapillicoccus sp.]